MSDIKNYLKKSGNIMLFITLFLLYCGLYSSLFVIGFKKANINVTNMDIVPKTIILTAISISFMLVLFLIYRKELKKEFVEYKNNFKAYLKLGVKVWAIGLLIMVISNIVLYLTTHLSPGNEKNIHTMLKNMPVYILFSTAIYAPFSEEMIFRKSLKKCISNPYLFIIISGLIFGGIHVITSKNPLEYLYIIPYGTFGVAFAYMYHKTKTIFTSITIHVIHNTILSLVVLFSLGVI